jgi:hypothetical protein
MTPLLHPTLSVAEILVSGCGEKRHHQPTLSGSLPLTSRVNPGLLTEPGARHPSLPVDAPERPTDEHGSERSGIQ